MSNLRSIGSGHLFGFRLGIEMMLWALKIRFSLRSYKRKGFGLSRIAFNVVLKPDHKLNRLLFRSKFNMLAGSQIIFILFK